MDHHAHWEDLGAEEGTHEFKTYAALGDGGERTTDHFEVLVILHYDKALDGFERHLRREDYAGWATVHVQIDNREPRDPDIRIKYVETSIQTPLREAFDLLEQNAAGVVAALVAMFEVCWLKPSDPKMTDKSATGHDRKPAETADKAGIVEPAVPPESLRDRTLAFAAAARLKYLEELKGSSPTAAELEISRLFAYASGSLVSTACKAARSEAFYEALRAGVAALSFVHPEIEKKVVRPVEVFPTDKFLSDEELARVEHFRSLKIAGHVGSEVVQWDPRGPNKHIGRVLRVVPDTGENCYELLGLDGGKHLVPVSEVAACGEKQVGVPPQFEDRLTGSSGDYQAVDAHLSPDVLNRLNGKRLHRSDPPLGYYVECDGKPFGRIVGVEPEAYEVVNFKGRRHWIPYAAFETSPGDIVRLQARYKELFSG